MAHKKAKRLAAHRESAKRQTREQRHTGTHARTRTRTHTRARARALTQHASRQEGQAGDVRTVLIVVGPPPCRAVASRLERAVGAPVDTSTPTHPSKLR